MLALTSHFAAHLLPMPIAAQICHFHMPALPAPSCNNCCPARIAGPPVQLKPGYDGVPKLLQAFEEGLPHKVAADPSGQLVFFGFSEVGKHKCRGSRRSLPCRAGNPPSVLLLPPTTPPQDSLKQ